jgi:hypothetical protein
MIRASKPWNERTLEMARTRKAKTTLKPAPTTSMRLVAFGHIEFTPETGGCFTGPVAALNALLTTMGYGEVAVRRNLMSRKEYIEAKDTPISCSPASETYWSM